MKIYKQTKAECFWIVLFVICLCAASSEAAVTAIKNASVTLMPMANLSDFAITTGLLYVGYLSLYLAFGGIFEYTNPAPKTPERVASMKKELRLGVFITFLNVSFSTVWTFAIDRYTPFYAYFSTHEYTLKHWIIGTLVYFLFTDTWFYWTHRLLHLKWFWKRIHFLHHSFIEPTAFCQDAVHWFEATIQGPCGHFFSQLLFPMHPIPCAVYGAFTALFAVAAHDGRPALDWNCHTAHHKYRQGGPNSWEVKGVNFALYFPFWDWICGTRYNPKTAIPWKPSKLLNVDDGKKGDYVAKDE